MAAGVPSGALADMLTSLADLLTSAPHLEFMLTWVKALCVHHAPTLGPAAQGSTSSKHTTPAALTGAVAPPLRALSKAITKIHEDLAVAADQNLFALAYLMALPVSKVAGSQTSIGGTLVDT